MDILHYLNLTLSEFLLVIFTVSLASVIRGFNGFGFSAYNQASNGQIDVYMGNIFGSYTRTRGGSSTFNEWNHFALTHNSSGSGTTTRFLHDGDFVRLRDVVVGYNLPQNIANRLGFDNVSFSARGLNLFTWTKDPGLTVDPEIRNSGSWEIYTPPLKSVSFGVNLKF